MKTTPPPTRWDELKQRLRQTTVAAQAASVRDSQRIADIYRQRAALLATPKSPGGVNGAMIQTLVLTLGEQRFGIPLRDVAQVYGERPLTPVPRTNCWISGIANFEGRIRAVVDLAALLDVSTDSREAAGKFLLVRSSATVAVLRVHGVEGIQSIDFDRLIAPDQQSDAAKKGLIVGLTPDHLIILGTSALLAHLAPPRGTVS